MARLRAQQILYTEMTHSQVAEELGVSYQTVQKIELRAINKLRENPIAKQLLKDIIDSEQKQIINNGFSVDE